MKDKYVEERHPLWFEFGGSNGNVYIATAQNDCVATVPQGASAKLIAEHNALVDAICEMARAFDAAAPEAFRAYWYGRKDG